jgi:hypothetical protein
MFFGLVTIDRWIPILAGLSRWGPVSALWDFFSLESGPCLTVSFLFQASLSSFDRHEPIIADIPP